MKIGVLDIQGSVEEHLNALQNLTKQFPDLEIVRVKNPEDLSGVSGLIIPGGESTTIGKLMKEFGLDEAVIKRVKEGMALWGTCAGAILMAKEIIGKDQADSLRLIDIAIERNAYGRQLDSFECELEFDFGKKSSHVQKKIPAVFIRAPKIVSVGKGVEILAKHGDEIVAARQGKLFVTNFHPELTDDLSIHQWLVEISLN